MKSEDETLSVAQEGEVLSLQQFLQDVYQRMAEDPSKPVIYFSNTGYNPVTLRRFDIVWGITLVDIRDQPTNKLN